VAFRGGITGRDEYVDGRFHDKYMLASKGELIPPMQLAQRM
jgi:hypothetical protein